MNDSPSPRAQLWVAVALLVVFGGIVVYMLAVADGNGQAWERRVYIFSGVEAIVFTAVGWIFGREVHRATAENAQAEAKDAKAEAKAEAKKANTLKGAIDSLPTKAAPAGGPSDVSTRSPTDAHIAALKEMADKLYGL